MSAQPTTVAEYLAALPEDRRKDIEAVRRVILENLDKDYEEGIQYRMIGYYVPHRVHPAGYHCDPKQPLPFAGLASQKNYMSLYLMCIYGGTERTRKFQEAWAKTGKKLDMGKACIRFKRSQDLALDVIANTIKAVPAKKYVEDCEAALQARKTSLASTKKAGGSSKSPGSKKGGARPARARK
jgi:hypothetical protein